MESDKMTDQYKVMVDSLRVRTQPTTAAKVVRTLYTGNMVDVISTSGGWAQLSEAEWACMSSSSGKTYLQLVTRGAETSSPPPEDTTEETKESQTPARSEVDVDSLEEEDVGSAYVPDFSSFTLEAISSTEDYLNNVSDSLSIKNCRGIHGMPYQFMPIADTRVSSGEGAFGRKYAEKIVSRMPLLLLTPGTPTFLKGYSSGEKKTILDKYVKVLGGGSKSGLDNLLNKNGKFYSLDPNWKKYYGYVNIMCRSAARFMGLHDTRIHGTRLDTFNWYDNIEADLSKIINYTRVVAFYIDSDKQIQESFSNDTTDSMLKSSINGLSDAGRELQFMLGTASSNTGIAFDRFTNQENLQENMDNMNEFMDKMLLGNGNIFQRLVNNIQTVVAGGKLIFPEIWSDSSFGRSYSINLKLISPDPDDLSIYLNIIVPMIHLICLVAPRQSTDSGYISPFMLRAFYKGQFNVDMGIIPNMSFTKGDEGGWTKSGLPTVVNVSFDIKDLYSSMSISNDTTETNLLNNTMLMDYLANMCGININEPDVFRSIEMYLTQKYENRIRDALRFNFSAGLEQWWQNKTMDIYSKLFR